MYTPAAEGTTDFKKFNEWKKEGYTIIKGSKAFPVWSQPTKREKKEEDGDTPKPAADDEETATKGADLRNFGGLRLFFVPPRKKIFSAIRRKK